MRVVTTDKSPGDTPPDPDELTIDEPDRDDTDESQDPALAPEPL